MAIDGAPFPVEPEVMAILETLWSAGHGAYLVGGGIRDRLLGIPTADWDITTDARPERILELFPGSSYENRFGTVQTSGFQITTFRRDHRYADHRRPERVTFSDDVYEDLARRDLTINAIAWGRRSPDSPAGLIDPADGQGDLRARLVRAVGDPDQRFDEDALRLLRAIRIAARLDFTIEPGTLAAMTAHAPDIAWVSGERVGGEIRRMLLGERPSRAFDLMRRTGMLTRVLPELAALADEPSADGRRSRLDIALDCVDLIAAGSPGDERLALAALTSQAGSAAARRTVRRLYVAARDADAVERIRAAGRILYEPAWSDAQVRRFMRTAGREQLDAVLTLRRCLAEAGGGGSAEDEARLRDRIMSQRAAGVPLILADLAVDGRDLRASLGIPESPLIGRLLADLLEDVIEDPSLNDRSMLLERARAALRQEAVQGPGGRSSGPSARLRT